MCSGINAQTGLPSRASLDLLKESPRRAYIGCKEHSELESVYVMSVCSVHYRVRDFEISSCNCGLISLSCDALRFCFMYFEALGVLFVCLFGCTRS